LDAKKFWWDNLGKYLHPGAKPGQDNVAIALSQNYKHATKASDLRLGSGKCATLITEGNAIMMADIRLDHAVLNGLRIMPGTWKTVPQWMAEIIMSPPDPPFMFVTYGKNPKIADKLRVNATADVVEICGAEQWRCSRAVVTKALDAIGDLPPTVWRKAAYLNDLCDRDPTSNAYKAWIATLDKLIEKHPSLQGALDALPPFQSQDYNAIALVHAVRMKHDPRPSDDANSEAA
jgi:hypothetical protein